MKKREKASAVAPVTILADALAAMIPRERNALRDYGWAVILTAVALAARLGIAPLDGGIQYVTFFPAVALAAVLGGFRAGLLAGGISVVLATYLFWPPYAAFSFEFRHATMLSNAVFLIDSIIVSVSIEAMHGFYRHVRDTEQQVRLAAKVFESASDGVMVTDAEGVIQAVNPAFTTITGYAAEEAVGQKSSLMRSDRHHPTYFRAMWKDLMEQGCWQGEIWNRKKTGDSYLAWMTISRIEDSGPAKQFVGIFHDVTALREYDARMQHLAFHDPLTGLPNRMLLEDRLRHAIARAEREDGRVGLLFVDLDGFKGVNDNLGHDVGDLLLCEIARRIKGRVRAMDTVARLGGDEFVILVEDAGADEYAVVGRGIVATISEPVLVNGHSVVVGGSVGIAVFPVDGANDAELMKSADIAMYRAKSNGRNNVHLASEIAPEGNSRRAAA